MVLDDAEDPRLVKTFLPVHDRGHVLFHFSPLRPRSSQCPNANQAWTLEPFCISKVSLEPVQFERKRTSEERDAARLLVNELGYLPLALEQAAAFIKATGATFVDYLNSYLKRRIELLEKEPTGAW